MADVTAQQIAATETAAPPSEPAQQELPVDSVAPDTTGQVAEETDEQKNARELSEQRERSEKRARGVQKRMDELTAEKYAERERANNLQRMLEQQLGRQQAPGQPQKSEDQEPQRSEFTDYEDYVSAKVEYRSAKKAEALINAKLQEAQQASQQQVVQEQANHLRREFVARQAEFAKSVPDYFEKVNTEEVRVPDHAAALLHTMDDAPALIYAMANHPQIAQRLWNEPPARQAILLGQLSAVLKVNPQVSNAPEPGKPTGARSGESGAPPSDMPGYLKWRAKQRSSNA